MAIGGAFCSVTGERVTGTRIQLEAPTLVTGGGVTLEGVFRTVTDIESIVVAAGLVTGELATGDRHDPEATIAVAVCSVTG